MIAFVDAVLGYFDLFIVKQFELQKKIHLNFRGQFFFYYSCT